MEMKIKFSTKGKKIYFQLKKSHRILFNFCESGNFIDLLKAGSDSYVVKLIAQGNQFLVEATIIYRRIAWQGMVKLLSKLTLILSHITQVTKIIIHVLVSYNLQTTNIFLNFCT